MYMLVYVDDIVIIGSNELFVWQVIGKIMMEFAIKKIGELKVFLRCLDE